jgi:hypothetical protein
MAQFLTLVGGMIEKSGCKDLSLPGSRGGTPGFFSAQYRNEMMMSVLETNG